MSFGLQVFGENGETVFDSQRLNLVYLGSYRIPATRTGRYTPPNTAGIEQMWVSSNQLTIGIMNSLAAVWVEGKTIRWEAQSTRQLEEQIVHYGGIIQ